MTNHHPLTGQSLPQPIPAPLRKLAMFDRDKECTEHSVSFNGRIPCTGDLRCHLCGTKWDAKTCQPIKPERISI